MDKTEQRSTTKESNFVDELNDKIGKIQAQIEAKSRENKENELPKIFLLIHIFYFKFILEKIFIKKSKKCFRIKIYIKRNRHSDVIIFVLVLFKLKSITSDYHIFHQRIIPLYDDIYLLILFGFLGLKEDP